MEYAMLYSINAIRQDVESKGAYNIYKNMYLQTVNMKNERYISESDHKSKAVWTVIKAETNQNYHIPRNNPNVITANDFNEFFSSIGTVTTRNIGDSEVEYIELLKSKIVDNSSSIYFGETTEHEIKDIITSMKNKRTEDIHDISYVVKKLAEELITPLTIIINKWIAEQCFPNQKKASESNTII